MDEQTKEIKVEEIQAKMNELLNMTEVENIIKSNQIDLEIEGVKYRIKKPTFFQKQQAYKKRVERFTELLQNDKYMLETDLKKVYLKRDIDIDAIQTLITEKTTTRDALMMQLGKAIKDQIPDTDLKQYKEEIDSINQEIQMLSIKKTQYLEFSIENQVMITTYSYLTYLTSEKLEGEKWIPVWNKYEDFLNDEKNIANRFSYYVAMMTDISEI